MNFNTQQLAQTNLALVGHFLFRSASIVKSLTVFMLFFLLAFSSMAQHDVALEKTVDMDSVAVGDTVTFSIHLSNQNMTNVAGLQVRDTLTAGLLYIDHVAPAGTTYDSNTGVWMVNNILNASTSTLTLNIRAKVLTEGMFMNIAEVIDMVGTDDDSTPNNEQLLEDDMDKACVSVPITICSDLNDMVMVTLLPMFTDIQWYKDGVVVPANEGGNQDTFYISSIGTYSFTALENGCPTMTCCPVVVKDSCFDLALRKTLASTQANMVPVGAEVDYVLELTNQGDLAALEVTVLDDVDLSTFAPFNVIDNPAGMTGGDTAIPYSWSNQGGDGRLLLQGLLLPGQTITIPVTLTVINAGQADNFAEIYIDDNRDRDSQPESQEMDGNNDTLVDDEINNANGDEDDHDVATLTVVESLLGDYVWYDLDGDGQQGNNEPGVPGVVVRLYDSNDNLLATDTTDTDGEYLFDNLAPGNYYVIFDIATLPFSYFPTQENVGNDTTDSDADITGRTQVVTLGMGDEYLDLDLGIESVNASVGDYVWFDTDLDGVQDVGEEGVEGIVVRLFDDNDVLVATDTTDMDGGYLFAGLSPDDYYVVFDTTNFSDSNYVVTLPNVGNDTLDSDGDQSGRTATFTLGPGEHNSTIDFGIYQLVFDLALEKTLAVGQNKMVNIGDEVSYFIKVTNEGGIDAYNILILDLIPDGLLFSPNNTGWTLLSPDSAEYTLPGPLMPGETDSVEILMKVLYGASGASIINVAEIEGVEDVNGVSAEDTDSTPNNGDPTEDDIDDEEVELLDHDPTGWIYCEKTGRIVTGSTISVMGPNGILNDEVAIVHNGINGYFEFYAIGLPGIYTIVYDGIYPMSLDCTPMTDTLDPTGLPTPIVLGVDTVETNMLSDTSCAANPYYIHFNLENGDPPILLNNIPVRCSFIGAIACEDTNGNEMPDSGDAPMAGIQVYLYECLDTINPIDSIITDSLGQYSFDGLTPGDYMVGVDLPMGARIVTSGPINPSGFSSCITLDWGDCDTVNNICFAFCPDVIAGTDVSHCSPTESTQLNATISNGSGSFSWSPTAGLSNPNIANPIASPDTTTTYIVTFDDGAGCIDMDTLVVNVGCTVPYLSYTPFSDSTIAACAGDTLPIDMPLFADACDSMLMVTVDSIDTPNSCGFSRIRTWTARNDCDSTFTFIQTVNVVDTIAPMAAEPSDTTVSCNAIPGPVTPTFTDNCDASLTIDYNQTIDSTNCGSVTITRTWMATDDCGNSHTVDQVITVVDDVAPTITFTHPWLAGLTDGDTLVMECSNTDIFNELDAQANDDCCSATVAFVENGITPGNCAADDFIVIMHCTWVATDEAGNSTSVTIHMRIEDNDPPVFTDVPGDLTVSCGSPVPDCTLPTITDACTDNLIITTDTTNVMTADGYDRICSWSATDECGNTATGAYTIHVTSNPGPTITGVPADLTVCLPDGDTIPDMAMVLAVDGCTGDTLDVTTFVNPSPSTDCIYTITRNWTVNNGDGTFTVLSQVVTVKDEVDYTLNVTPDTCGVGMGTATFSPNTHSYAWSDGGSGDNRTDLTAGTYMVTITKAAGCTDTVEVTIDDDCNCIMPVLDSLVLVSADCGQSNGAATIHLVGDESLYDYLWVPFHGTANAVGNGKN